MEHERLECYQQLMKVAGDVAKRMTNWPRGHANLADQLRRAITSAVLNLSEGNGRRGHPAERRRFFEISMGSIAEVASCLDLARAFGLMSGRAADGFKNELRAAYYRIRKLP